MLCSESLWMIFIKNSAFVSLSQLISPCPPLFLLGNQKFLLRNHKSMRPFLFGKEVCLSPFLAST